MIDNAICCLYSLDLVHLCLLVLEFLIGLKKMLELLEIMPRDIPDRFSFCIARIADMNGQYLVIPFIGIGHMDCANHPDFAECKRMAGS